jgi:hypothetical protein
MTIDNLHSELRNDPVHLDPTDPELWTLAEKAANIIWRYQHGVGISEVLGLDELQTLAVYNQAFRLEMLDDQLQTVLAEIRQRTQFSRLRLYLTIEPLRQVHRGCYPS